VIQTTSLGRIAVITSVLMACSVTAAPRAAVPQGPSGLGATSNVINSSTVAPGPSTAPGIASTMAPVGGTPAATAVPSYGAVGDVPSRATVAATPVETSPSDTTLVTTRGKMIMGVYLDHVCDGSGCPNLDAFVASMGGVSPKIVPVFQPWLAASENGTCSTTTVWNCFDGSAMTRIQDHAPGARVMISWQPCLGACNPRVNSAENLPFKLSNIVRGDFDTYLHTWAQKATTWRQPFYLRFAFEMNGNWFPWGNVYDNTPTLYKQAWRHVWSIFHTEAINQGLTRSNAHFVWSPNSPCTCTWTFPRLYPGDKYVDVIGISAYNWGSANVFQTWGHWQTMVQAYSSSMSAINTLTTSGVSRIKKPVWVTETGSAPANLSKADWIKYGYPAAYNKWPRIKAIIYFDALDPAGFDWRLTNPTINGAHPALKAYRALVHTTQFQGKLP